MFNRPRCRDWSPLATQQLRLRNLVKVTGHNIMSRIKSQLYFTLHKTEMSAPFYTSERVYSHGSATVDWSEINSQIILKSTLRYVFVRVWEYAGSAEDSSYNFKIRNNSECGDMKKANNIDNSNSDKLLFLWGVYFSGLVPLTKPIEAKFQINSLTFQIHDTIFASAESLNIDTLRQQLSIFYQHEQDSCSMPLAINAKSNNLNIFHRNNDGVKKTATKSCDSDLIDLYSDIGSCSTSTAAQTNSDFQINSPRTSRSGSPVRDIQNDIKERSKIFSTSESVRDLVLMIKTRYIKQSFLNSEIRPSYNLNKLLNLQEKQRKLKYKSEVTKEIMEQICMKSAFCLNLELISNKGYIYRPKGNPSMGRTLNRLLFEDNRAKPEDILKAQNLRRQIETAKFRTRLLRVERDRAKESLQKLELKLGNLQDDNIELGSWLMTSYRNLSREKETLVQQKTPFNSQRDFLQSLKTELKSRQSQLCYELQEIYPIETSANGHLSLNNIVLRNTEIGLYNGSESNCSWEPVNPLSLSAALGYTAHIVQMCSIILNLPLRNPIKHEGSRSRILDIARESSNTSREYPLYSRTSPPPKPVLYAIYLLNQNIAQLNFQVRGAKCDLRMILPNLLYLLTGPTITADSEKNTILDDDSELGSVCGSSVDLDIPAPLLTSKPVNVDLKRNDERISRSMGSYSDENLSNVTKSFYNSEPILNIQTVHIVKSNENGNV